MAMPVVAGYTTPTPSNSAVNTIRLTKPANVAVGDCLIIIVANEEESTDPITGMWDNTTNNPRLVSDASDAGFTLIDEGGSGGSDTRCAAFYRVADGTEEATIDVVSNNAGGSSQHTGFYIRVTGAHATSPLDGSSTWGADGADTTHDVTGYTTIADNVLAFALLSLDGGDYGTFTYTGTGWTETTNAYSDATATGVGLTWGTKEVTGGAATGTVAIAQTPNDGIAFGQFGIAEGASASSIIPPSVQNLNQGINPHKVARLGGHLEE